MLVTINTDASHCSFTKDASYAFMVCCNAGVFKKSGRFSKKVDNAMFAELMCIANALHFTRNHPDLWGISKIIINTDCLNGIDMILRETKMTKKNKKYRQVRGVITKYIGKYKGSEKIPVQFKHVKSHTNKTDGRSKANDWCDKQAKKERKICS